MAYTFGAGTGDDITWTALTMNGANSINLMGGWFYPTTLTGGRFLLSNGNVVGLALDPTNSAELRLYLDRVTTDAEFVTSGAGVVTNAWQFLGVVWASTNAAQAAQFFLADEMNPPRWLSSSTAAAGSGNVTAGGTAVYAGNRGTGTVAFQGGVAEVFMMVTSSTISQQNTSQWLAASGALDAAALDLILREVLTPIWEDCIPYNSLLWGATPSQNYMLSYAPFDSDNRVVYNWGRGTQQGLKLPTVNGATFTANHPARRSSTPPNFPYRIPRL